MNKKILRLPFERETIIISPSSFFILRFYPQTQRYIIHTPTHTYTHRLSLSLTHTRACMHAHNGQEEGTGRDGLLNLLLPTTGAPRPLTVYTVRIYAMRPINNNNTTTTTMMTTSSVRLCDSFNKLRTRATYNKIIYLFLSLLLLLLILF